jgi:hypothetical protein
VAFGSRIRKTDCGAQLIRGNKSVLAHVKRRDRAQLAVGHNDMIFDLVRLGLNHKLRFHARSYQSNKPQILH